jgi:hypothetical protein
MPSDIIPTKEYWRSVVGYEDLYAVSTFGYGATISSDCR